MDPYRVLGVSYNASDDEIKTAYKKLSRQYHPDANVGKPNQAELEERFKEVQQAYQMIMDQRKRQAEDPWANFQSRYQQQAQGDATGTNPYIRSAVNYINNGYYREGLNVLEQIPEEGRDGEWYYVSAVANYQIGNNGIALEHAKCACALDPNNFYYQNFLAKLQGGGQRYQQTAQRYGFNPTTVSTNNCCSTAIAAMCISSVCGGCGFPIICCL